jgi:serine/threonine protein kinase
MPAIVLKSVRIWRSLELAAHKADATIACTSAVKIDERWFVPISDIVERRKLGSGSLGVVVEAIWQQAITVAIKKLHFLDEAALAAIGIVLSTHELLAIRDRLLHECHTNSNLRHPNIVQFLGVVVDASTREPRMLMMEHMSGGSLAVLLHGDAAGNGRAALDTKRQVAILIDVCCALRYLHSRQPPILHLDIKPDNILLDGVTGRAKLSDLGESHLVQSVAQHTRRSTVIGTTGPFGVGTPLYMAPEMRHVDDEKSSRTDMFSMGVVMCEVSSGRRPNPGPETERIAGQRLLREVPEPERRAADIASMRNEQLRSIVEHLIVDEMRERSSAQQVLASLQRLVHDSV